MCLAVPAKVLEVDLALSTARVDYLGSQITVGTALLEAVRPGQYVLVHVGEAIAVIDEEHAHEGIALWKEWAKEL
ncbi:MAG TPA: HypC/HybG/HupF family hydrogenase formation chaperone [Symbiobacteriaceae bacterium]|nr:HypC/HybG/HupF family hydrogenase formation chaperone [Symbiobacteriaceae bacterium]